MPTGDLRVIGPPNFVFLLMDNLGYGEVGCYGGGVTRGAPTPRIDKLAREGTRLTNFNVEGFPVFVADRLEAVKWRNWKVVFYDEQRDWWTPPTKLGSPKAFNLITTAAQNAATTSSSIAGPIAVTANATGAHT